MPNQLRWLKTDCVLNKARTSGTSPWTWWTPMACTGGEIMKKLEDVVSSLNLDVFGKEGGTVRQKIMWNPSKGVERNGWWIDEEQ